MKYLKWFFTFAAMLIIGFQVDGQSFTKYAANESGKVFVTGTSTLHKWEENLQKFTVTVLAEQVNSQGIVFKDIQFSALVGNLKSETTLMDTKTFKALKKEKYPTISFSSKGPTALSVAENKFAGKVNGFLTIAGIRKQVLVEVKGSIKNGKIHVSGIYSVSMSEYNIKPPTFLFGSIKTGNNIKVHFNFQFNKIYNTHN